MKKKILVSKEIKTYTPPLIVTENYNLMFLKALISKLKADIKFKNLYKQAEILEMQAIIEQKYDLLSVNDVTKAIYNSNMPIYDTNLESVYFDYSLNEI
jgi:hypothetical protein